MAPPRRTLETLAPFMGRDLMLEYALRQGYFEDADLRSERAPGRGVARDVALTDGIDNFTQAVANRLKTRKGELAALGHPDYGSRHHDLLGEPNVARTRNLIKLYVLQALRDEPRIEMTVRVLGQPAPLTLVLPFSLEVAL